MPRMRYVLTVDYDSEHPSDKVRLQIVVRPDLAEWLERTAGDGHGEISRYVESLINRAEIESRLL